MAFISEELRNSYEGVGRALDKATSPDEAASVVAAYFGRDGARWQAALEKALQSRPNNVVPLKVSRGGDLAIRPHNGPPIDRYRTLLVRNGSQERG